MPLTGRKFVALFHPGGALRPFRLLQQDLRNLPKRYVSDWTVFNQLIFASAVYVFFTNLLPGITFASDLYNLTGKNWGSIEVVFSTGLCGIIFSLYVIQSNSQALEPHLMQLLADSRYSHSLFWVSLVPFPFLLKTYTRYARLPST